MVVIPKACAREIEVLPEEIRCDLADALARLDAGLMLSMGVDRSGSLVPAIGLPPARDDLALRALDLKSG